MAVAECSAWASLVAAFALLQLGGVISRTGAALSEGFRHGSCRRAPNRWNRGESAAQHQRRGETECHDQDRSGHREEQDKSEKYRNDTAT